MKSPIKFLDTLIKLFLSFSFTYLNCISRAFQETYMHFPHLNICL